MSLEQSLLLNIWQGHLTTAARMVSIGNYHMAAAELRSALTVLDQLFALSTPTGLHHSAQGCEPRATLGNPSANPTNPEGVASPAIDV